MAFGATVNVAAKQNNLDTPVSVVSEWYTAVAIGGVDAADNSGNDVQNPDTQCDTEHHLIDVGGKGTLACVRLGYDDGDTPNVDPVVQIFGRTDTTGRWQRLPNIASTPAEDITLTTDESNDVTDATDFFSEVGDDHTVDVRGCDQLIVAVKTAYTVSAGNAALAYVQIKVY